MELEKYIISIEKNGQMVPVGLISGEDYRTAQFSYMDEYLVQMFLNKWTISHPYGIMFLSDKGAFYHGKKINYYNAQ